MRVRERKTDWEYISPNKLRKWLCTDLPGNQEAGSVWKRKIVLWVTGNNESKNLKERVMRQREIRAGKWRTGI